MFRPRAVVTGAGDVRHVANDHDRIIVGRLREKLHATIGHGAVPGGAAPQQLESSVAIVARCPGAASFRPPFIATVVHCSRPTSIKGDGSTSAMAAFNRAAPNAWLLFHARRRAKRAI